MDLEGHKDSDLTELLHSHSNKGFHNKTFLTTYIHVTMMVDNFQDRKLPDGCLMSSVTAIKTSAISIWAAK